MPYNHKFGIKSPKETIGNYRVFKRRFKLSIKK